jgi:hypothetical protein
MSERHYNEAEVRRILELATRPTDAQPAARAQSGMTLAEIQSIAGEVGIDAGAIARAAASLDAAAVHPARRSLGIPIEVGHTVHLPRPLTDDEWEQLVAELRSTFRARGNVRVKGNTREWYNGNLHARVEPGPSGYRLRMGTIKGDASGFNTLGVMGILGGGATLLLAGDPQSAIAASGVLGAMGAGTLIANLFRLPRWRAERRSQMRHIATRVAAMVRGNEPEAGGSSSLPAPDEPGPSAG